MADWQTGKVEHAWLVALRVNDDIIILNISACTAG